MDQPKIYRMLRCIALLSNNRVLTVDEIAEKLEVSQRTVYRYIDTFIMAGFSVVKVDDYKYRMVSIGNSLDDLSNIVCFSDEEAFIVNRLIDSLSPDNALKAGLRKKLAAVYDSTGISQFVDNKCTAKIVEVLVNAIKEKKVVEIKEVRLSPNIEENDLNTKVNQARKFLQKGNRVKVTLRFRGRELAYVNQSKVILDNFAELLSDISTVDKQAKFEGRSMFMFLAAKTSK